MGIKIVQLLEKRTCGFMFNFYSLVCHASNITAVSVHTVLTPIHIFIHSIIIFFPAYKKVLPRLTATQGVESALVRSGIFQCCHGYQKAQLNAEMCFSEQRSINTDFVCLFHSWALLWPPCFLSCFSSDTHSFSPTEDNHIHAFTRTNILVAFMPAFTCTTHTMALRAILYTS